MFRKTKFRVLCDAVASPIYERQSQVQDDGSVRYFDVDVTSEEYKSTLPTIEDYTLDNLIKAGVPLKAVPTHGLLGMSDPVAADAIVSVLDSSVSSENVKS